MLIGYQRRILGSIYGGCSPLFDVPLLIDLYQSGDLKLDELITRRYRLEDVDQDTRNASTARTSTASSSTSTRSMTGNFGW